MTSGHETYDRFNDAATGCQTAVDLWNTTGPAYSQNGTAYEEYLFTNNTLRILDGHPPNEPLFLFHSFHALHLPLQVPEEYEVKYGHLSDQDHKRYKAMLELMDDQVGKLVAKFREKGMWENTLMVLTSDNGGGIYGGPICKWCHPGASNAPLRGGKFADWEGGIRVNAFVSGGFLPVKRRGIAIDDFIHIADWYTTFCHLAGVDATDERAAAAGLPPVDGLNQWPLLSGDGNGTRTEIHVSAKTLIQGKYKLLTGFGEWARNTSWLFPNPFILMNGKWPGYGWLSALYTYTRFRYCGGGCLYNIFDDPEENEDVAASHTQLREDMLARLDELNKGLFKPDRGTTDPAACEQIKANGGFLGPWVDVQWHSPGHCLQEEHCPAN